MGGAEPVVGCDRQRDRRIDAGQFLDADAVVDGGHARAAVLFRKLDAHQSERREPRDQIGGKLLCLIPFAHVRAHLGFGELADTATEQVLLRGQTKVHRRSDSTIMDLMIPTSTTLLLRRVAVAATAMVLVAMTAAPARADATVFIGANTTPSNRPVKGFAAGMELIIVAFEFEYAATSDDVSTAAPSLKTFMGDALLQAPLPIFGFLPYVTAGGGVYRETLGAHQQTSAATNIGGGVKVSLAGPLRLRVDYRVFKLGSGALNSPAHRIYAGLNLKF